MANLQQSSIYSVFDNGMTLVAFVLTYDRCVRTYVFAMLPNSDDHGWQPYFN
ncbi:hypothetical protein SAMN05880593_114109 [Rhizobium sp. RU36D]|nr:hypothetical protein SAMN05880593_114109 [Rhizobium sp. RU36D]